MKKIFVFVMILIAIHAQEISVDEIIIYKKLWSEDQIITKLEARNHKMLLTDKDIEKLKKAGFSAHFIKRLAAQSKKDSSLPKTKNDSLRKKTFQVKIEIFPKNAGEVVIKPPLATNGKIALGTEIYIQPIGKDGYLFERWQGDRVGYSPIHITVKENIYLTAHFAKHRKASPPPKINNKAIFSETRKEGHTYLGKATGVIDGRGQNTNWGIQGQMNYKYIYQINYSGHVEKNDGFRIREIRTFDLVDETLVTSKFQLKLDVSRDLQGIIEFTKNAGKMLRNIGLTTRNPNIAIGGATIEGAVHATDQIIQKLEKYTLHQKQVDTVLSNVEMVIGKKDFIENWKKRLSNPQFGKIIGYTPQMKILEGKTFKLEYEDGIGLINVETLNGVTMTVQERELIERAFYLSDHFIFRDNDEPNKPIEIGDSWNVDARNIAGALDPRLRHEIEGEVKLTRNANIQSDNRKLAVFNVAGGNAKLLGSSYPQRVEGRVWIKDGKILYDTSNKYVYRTNLSGKASYKELSQDHLLFGTRFSSDPTFKIIYECICKPSKK